MSSMIPSPNVFPGPVGFYGAAPAAQGTAFTQTFATADPTLAAFTSADMPAGGTGTAAGGWDTAANRNTAIANFNALRVDHDDLARFVNSLVDNLQLKGLIG